MTDTLHDLRVNSDRMLAAFNDLAHSRRLGATGDGGVNRPTFSEAHLAARTWFREQIESAGLEFRTDGAGNHSAFLLIWERSKQSASRRQNARFLGLILIPCRMAVALTARWV